MRMMMNIRIPHEPFNSLVRDGEAGAILDEILEDMKPEAIYFTEQGGQRTLVAIVDLPDASSVPGLAEPWFLSFEADCEFHVVMTPEDMQRAGLEELGERWG